MSDVEDIVRRLQKLAKAKKADYSLGTRMTEAKVKAFEKKHGITLPDEYRAFVLAIGEGAAGPEYGLIALEEAVKERGRTIYDLSDEFPSPLTTGDYLDFAVGGILPVQYSGCSYYTGIITTGPDRGQMWFSVEDRPGWVPHWRGDLVDAKGKPFKMKGEDYRALYDAVLAKPNRNLRVGFATWYSDWLAGEEKSGAPS